MRTKKYWARGRERSRIRRSVYERDGNRCYICGVQVRKKAGRKHKKHRPTLDHVIPRSRGGSDDADNLKVCCSGCNQEKDDKMPVVWTVSMSSIHYHETLLAVA